MLVNCVMYAYHIAITIWYCKYQPIAATAYHAPIGKTKHTRDNKVKHIANCYHSRGETALQHDNTENINNTLTSILYYEQCQSLCHYRRHLLKILFGLASWFWNLKP